MSNQEFDIIFRGDIVFGHQLADVKQRLQQLFKADAAKVDALFSGRPLPLKRGLDQASAEKYKEALTRAGAQVDIVPSGETKSVSVSVARPLPTPPATTPIAGAPLTLAQRLEQQAAAAEKEAADRASVKVEQKREQEARALAVAPSGAQTSWSLAPLGTDLLQPTERVTEVPVVVDIGGLSLRPAEAGNILDANEQPPEAIATVVAPNFGVAEAGADLIRVDEKMDLPLLEIELDDWGLADLGEDLISVTEKPQIAVPVIHIPDVGLAPVGADLGQLKSQVKAVVPDISGIRLAD